jgi:hypothetical protein
LEHLTKQFLKIYEVEIAKVLGSLGASIERYKQASSSKPSEKFHDVEMSL